MVFDKRFYIEAGGRLDEPTFTALYPTKGGHDRDSSGNRQDMYMVFPPFFYTVGLGPWAGDGFPFPLWQLAGAVICLRLRRSTIVYITDCKTALYGLTPSNAPLECLTSTRNFCTRADG